MTTTASAFQPASGDELETLRPLIAAAARPALRLATPLTVTGARAAAGSCLLPLRSPNLVSALRQARAERFSDRYEWLSLRRRRAQIAARHALAACE
jgi:hypothetical protein